MTIWWTGQQTVQSSSCHKLQSPWAITPTLRQKPVAWQIQILGILQQPVLGWTALLVQAVAAPSYLSSSSLWFHSDPWTSAWNLYCQEGLQQGQSAAKPCPNQAPCLLLLSEFSSVALELLSTQDICQPHSQSQKKPIPEKSNLRQNLNTQALDGFKQHGSSSFRRILPRRWPLTQFSLSCLVPLWKWENLF